MHQSALSVLIPAAGASKRLGQAKQLVKYNGISLIQNAMNIAGSITPLEIIVVTGANAKAVRDAVEQPPAHWIHNPQWSGGMGGSIAVGASAINPESTGLLILLCDQYRVDAHDLQELVRIWQSDPGRIVAAESEGCMMPPVIFPARCFKQLKCLEGNHGARSLFSAYPELLTPVAMKNAAFDLDTQTHLKTL